MDELDDMSEAASSYVLPKTVAPMGNQERSSVADSNLFNEGTLRGSILRGRSRIAQERMKNISILVFQVIVFVSSSFSRVFFVFSFSTNFFLVELLKRITLCLSRNRKVRKSLKT